MNILLTNQRLNTEIRNANELIQSLKLEIDGLVDGYSIMESIYEEEASNKAIIEEEHEHVKKRLENADEAVARLTERKNELCKIAIKIEKQKSNLDDLICVQNSDGNWNYDEYMFGLANGLIVAKNCFENSDIEPKFLDAPKKFLYQQKPIWIRITRWASKNF